MVGEKHVCAPENVALFKEWLLTRGGLALWGSVNLSDPGKSWTTPVRDKDGQPTTKPHWGAANEPYRIIIDPVEVEVIVPKEVKRFHIAVRMGSQGFMVKLTDASTRKFKVSRQTVYNWIHSGALGASRAGGLIRITRQQLDLFVIPFSAEPGQ